MKVLQLIILSLLCFYTNAQTAAKAKIPADLIAKLSGVKYGLIPLSEDQFQMLKNNSALAANLQTYSAFADFLKTRLNLTAVALSPTQQKELYRMAGSACDIVTTDIATGNFKSSFGAVGTINNNSILFLFCDSSSFVIDIGKINVSGLTTWNTKIRSTLNALPFPKITYNDSNKSSLPSVPYVITPAAFENYLAAKKYSYEGEYEQTETDEFGAKGKVGLMNTGDTIKIIYLGGASNPGDWQPGELKGYIFSTKSEKVFNAWLYYSNKRLDQNEGSLIFDDENLFTLNFTNYHQKFVRIK